MPAQAPRDSTIAVVGDGFGSLLVYSTALYVGVPKEALTVYGPSPRAVGTYLQFATNLGQTVLRSESESHFLPADWPTFAQLNAWTHKNPSYLWRSIRRKYHPGVPEIMVEADVVQHASGWDDVRVPTRVGWLQREENPAHFVLYDEQANFIGRAKHVMLALGHGPLVFPPVLAKARETDPEIAARIVQGYEPKAYHPHGRYVVLGAGIASVNEWANALDAGAKVLALTRREIPDEQDLNVPRCLFEAQGIDIFQGASFDQRIALLGQVLRGTHPRREGWQDRVERGVREGRFEQALGEIAHVERGPAGLRIQVSNSYGQDLGWLDVTGIICPTGFNKSALTLPLFRRLVEHYGVPVEEGRIKLKTNCGMPRLDRPDSRLCLMGINANNVIPHGDTIAGLKYIARRFVADCARAERIRRRSFPSRLTMQLRMASQAARAMRTIPDTQQLA
jgi:hypothetical protein